MLDVNGDREVGIELLRIQTTLFNLISALVDQPHNLKINVIAGEQMNVFEVHCEAKDRGKIIGKQGNMANSLRQILIALSAKNGLRSILEICD